MRHAADDTIKDIGLSGVDGYHELTYIDVSQFMASIDLQLPPVFHEFIYFLIMVSAMLAGTSMYFANSIVNVARP